MHADIERLIALQGIDSAIHAAERTLSDEPARLDALDVRLTDAKARVAAAKESVAQNATARRDIEKDVTLHQGRLSKFREHSMNVKTNQEFHAIQHEMSFAQNEIKSHEDRMLERMVELDELTATLTAAEAALASLEKEVAAERKAIAAEHDVLRSKVDGLRGQRVGVLDGMAPASLSVFDMVSKRRNGVAMAEAKEGICTVCHVRLRPQVFNTVRKNESVIQCDSCQRILYFVTPVAVPSAETTS